jgi:hypothetical protein
MLSKKLVDGRLVPVPVEDTCIIHALECYKKRHQKDTNPAIVQMILRGDAVPHYYYRSDHWIDQPYLIPFASLDPYVGSSDQADDSVYGQGCYKEYREINHFLPEKLEKLLCFLYEFHGFVR